MYYIQIFLLIINLWKQATSRDKLNLAMLVYSLNSDTTTLLNQFYDYKQLKTYKTKYFNDVTFTIQICLLVNMEGVKAAFCCLGHFYSRDIFYYK